MEFIATTTIPASAADLQRRLTISELPRWCASIEQVMSDERSGGEIHCVWGIFRAHRENVCSGVRFSLPGCPHSLQWTVTTGHLPAPRHTLIHLTINGTDHDPDFIDSIRQFVE